MTKIFITGATGYIGGDVLHAISTAHPDYEITALVRNSDKGAKIASQYPKVKLVYGDLDSTELLVKEASGADVVCRFVLTDLFAEFADNNHESAAQALITGLKATHSADKPGFFIHTSGAGTLWWEDVREKRYGQAHAKVYDDLDGISEVTSLPDDAAHRLVDKLILAAGAEGEKEGLFTAIVCPPVIYGPGRGPDNQRSIQVPDLVKRTLERGSSFVVGEGLNYWTFVHVQDLSKIYLKLVEEAVAGGSTSEWPGKPAVWGKEGYYFAETEELQWKTVAGWVAEEAKKKGWIKTEEVKSIGPEEAEGLLSGGAALWGVNGRGHASRARQVLRWTPDAPNVHDTILPTLEAEAKALEVTPGHAKIAAGDA